MTDDYPLSPKYTIDDVDEADRLYDEMPLSEVSEETGIPQPTLSWWHVQGYIDSEVNHKSRSQREYSDETIERADYLWDRMPLTKISDILDVPYGVLRNWSHYGWISTEVDHSGYRGRPQRNRRRAHRAAELVHDHGYLQKEAAEKMGVSQSTISRYLQMYRTGEYVAPERHA